MLGMSKLDIGALRAAADGAPTPWRRKRPTALRCLCC